MCAFSNALECSLKTRKGTRWKMNIISCCKQMRQAENSKQKRSSSRSTAGLLFCSLRAGGTAVLACALLRWLPARGERESLSHTTGIFSHLSQRPGSYHVAFFPTVFPKSFKYPETWSFSCFRSTRPATPERTLSIPYVGTVHPNTAVSEPLILYRTSGKQSFRFYLRCKRLRLYLEAVRHTPIGCQGCIGWIRLLVKIPDRIRQTATCTSIWFCPKNIVYVQ